MAIGTPVSLGTNFVVGAVASVSLTTTAAIQAGDLVVVVVDINSGVAGVQTVSSVSDGTNTYVKAVSRTGVGTNGTDVELWYKQRAAAVGSGATITATFSGTTSGAAANHIIGATRIPGVSGLAVDTANSQTAGAGNTSPSVATGALAIENEIVISVFGGVGVGASPVYTESSGFTTIASNIGNAQGYGLWFSYLQAVGKNSISYQPTLGQVNASETELIASFRPAATVIEAQNWTAVGSLAASGFRSIPIAARFSGAGTLAAGTIATSPGAARFAGVGTMRVDGFPQQFGSARFAGVGTMRVDWYPRAGARFAGVGSMIVDADVIRIGRLLPYTGDRHVRRTGDDYASALANLLPRGVAWSRNPDSVIMSAVNGLAQIMSFFDGRAADLLERESDPRATIELLPDWERNFGLPDKCLSEPLTIPDRQVALTTRMTLLGDQSRQFFINLAKQLGYAITITEYSPFQCGISQCGDTRDEHGDPRWQLGSEEMRFFWTIHVDNARLTWFRVDAGVVGVDPLLRIGLATDLECIMRRWKPAHTDIVFDYSGLVTGGPFAGLP